MAGGGKLDPGSSQDRFDVIFEPPGVENPSRCEPFKFCLREFR